MTAGIEKMKALALAATPGPWRWWTSNSTLRLTGADCRDGGVLHAYIHAGWADISCSAADQAFIAACREMVPELIAEVERLRAELAERDSALHAEPAGQHDEGDEETLDQKAENALLWCYRRLKNSYGRLPFVEEAVAGLRARTATAGAAKGGEASLKGLERYGYVYDEGDEFIGRTPDGEYCKVADVEAILGTAPAAGTVEKDAVIAAAEKLIKAKGRFHTEQNYKALADALAAHTKAAKESTG